MATTSLKLPDEVKEQAAHAASRLGLSPHAFMVEAIRKAAAAAEERARFVASAQAARKTILESGKGFDGTEVHVYIRARAVGKVAGKAASKARARPKVKPWRA
jgi:predicted transcriptional regulator